MIKLENVSKIYQIGGEEFYALRNINLEIKKGEMSAIVGPSGSGKSTLMHIIGLLDTPTRGKVILEDKDVSKMSDNKLSYLRNKFIGFIFQQFNLINKLTVQENIILPTIYSREKLDFNPVDKARKIMERFGILEKAESYPNKISGGQQQRVAVARSLMNDPSLILADEPTGNLDTRTGQSILKLLKDLNQEQKITVILVTHDKEVSSAAKRIITIRDGEVVR